MICPNLSNPNVKAEFDYLTGLFGRETALVIFDRNGGNPLYLSPTGKPSSVFKYYLDKFGDIDVATKLKARLYSSKFGDIYGKWWTGSEGINLDSSGEPIIFDAGNTITIPELNEEVSGGLVDIQQLIENGEITFTDEEGNPCAALGGKKSKFKKGSEWEVVKDLKGYPSHAQGGVDLNIGPDGVSFIRGKTNIKAANGLVLPAIKAANGLVIGEEDPPTTVNKLKEVNVNAKAPKGYFNKDKEGNILLTPEQFKNDFNFTKMENSYYELSPKKRKNIEKAFGEKLPKDHLISFLNTKEMFPENYSELATNYEFNNKYDEFIMPDREEFISKYAKSNEDWKKAYSDLNTDIKSIDNYKKKVLSGYVLKKPRNNRSYITEVTKNTIDPLMDKILEYKNSNSFIERLAGSFYNKEIDIDKWISEPWYREQYTKRYLNENPKDSKELINEIRNINPEISYEDTGTGSSYIWEGGIGDKVKSVSANNVLHGKNYNSIEEWDLALDKFLEDKKVNPYFRDQIKETMKESLSNINTSSVVSHEQYHNQFDKTNLIDRSGSDFREKYDKIFPENNLIWELNEVTKNIPIDKFKETLGYATYDEKYPEKSLTHEMSPEETKADIHSTRDYLRYKYDFEHIDNQFNDDIFEKLMNDKEWKESLIGKRMIKRFGEDKKKWKIIMNLIAANYNTSRENSKEQTA